MNHQEIEQSIQTLQDHKQAWATLPIPQKIDLLLATREQLGKQGDALVEAAARGKYIDPRSPWVGEEWVIGPWALAASINGYLETLHALAEGHPPKVKTIRTRANGQVIVQVFPHDVYDQVLLSGIRAEVWMQPGVTAANLHDHMAGFYRQMNPQGKVALVLGSGNVSGIPPLDVLYRLYALGHVVLLKPNPVNEYLGPILEDIFTPFVQAGYLRFVYGGADVGDCLVHHPGIEEIHITGSACTHDMIVFGPGAAGAERKRRHAPTLNKPISSELGAAIPVIIVPGRWSTADIRYQAENVVTMKLHNSGFNCAAAQVLILPAVWEQRDEFMAAVRRLMRELPPRQAYYPGAAERQQAALAAHPEAELLGGDVPRTLITELDPNAVDETCFTTEVFDPVLAQTSLPGDDATAYLRNAVRFCNEKLSGTLGATIIIHPREMHALAADLDEAIANLRYGAVGVNVWHAMAFLLAQTTWGAYPGHTVDDIQSGIGVVRNSLLFDDPEKSVTYGPFYPFPRSWLHADLSLLPRPPWFVTNKTAQTTAKRVARFATDPGLLRVPGILVSALRG